MKANPPSKEQLAQIAMHVSFGCRIQSLSLPREFLLNSDDAKGMAGSVIITQLDDDNIQGSSDISHPENDDRPILRRMESVTIGEMVEWAKISVPSEKFKEIDFESDHKAWVKNIKNKGVMGTLVETEVAVIMQFMMFCVERKLDFFGLIDQGQAFDAEKGK